MDGRDKFIVYTYSPDSLPIYLYIQGIDQA